MIDEEFLSVAHKMADHLEEFRREVIEECARVAEQWGYSDVVLAIRALKKEKP